MSRGTFARFVERITRLYEQGAGLERIVEYVKHWFKWVRTGIGWLANLNLEDWIKKRLNPSVNEEFRRLYNEAIMINNYLCISHCFLLFTFPHP